MMNNDVMRSLRYTMKVNDQKLAEIIALAGGSTAVEEIHNMLLSEDDPKFKLCPDNIMAYFLDGLIYFKRGKDESKPPMPFEFPITNNVILKKIRVAFELKEDDIHEILKSADCPLGRSELSALMRKKGHPNYRECGDQIMRYFLKGLQKKFRP
jgi:uncharacterized protein YehS (DUF1456 family)